MAGRPPAPLPVRIQREVDAELKRIDRKIRERERAGNAELKRIDADVRELREGRANVEKLMVALDGG